MKNTSPQALAEPIAGEGAMSLLLTSLMAIIIAQQLFGLSLSLAPGLSVSNALLYVVAGALALKFAIFRNLRFELRSLHIWFALLLGYAAMTIPVVTLLAPFDGYKPLVAIISYKGRLLDQFVFFAVFFYGLQSTRSASSVLKVLLVMMAIANFVALLDAWGIVDTAGLIDRDDGRAQGVMGESNQTAAFIASFLPGLAAFAYTTRGPTRFVWIGAVVVATMAMTISASRGGFLAVIVAVLWGLAYFRRYISGRSVFITCAIGAVAIAVVMPLIASKYGFLLFSRMIADSTSSNLAGASSGRLDIWANAVAAMARAPLSFIIGYGWDAYDAMAFRFNTHNHYLKLWFDLGLIGLIGGIGLLIAPLRVAMRAVNYVSEAHRATLIAFAMGAFAITIAAFFVNLYTPWLWFWAYAGLAMRIAANAFRERAAVSAAEQSEVAKVQSKKDPFGWIGSTAPGAGR